ncbi:conserved hypothetical protein [Leishmania infantum JPCM5]|uniref:Domain_of_uncharacterized_function_(DUF1935)_-_pu tative n=3 Tax=Leishmania donovani species complex TaxID=38574 RepID=A0A6L0XBM5_LEIIN|nr:conserved hypothetical protein [Leishmania infantum JPCM5]XP_003860472.1 hypothetical protein, conserved [Leishmania donovani]CAC9484669.1 Domain_of_uncharacterised_function_(DUF1935)_-_putative [Leishmania infantum]AYU78411.1 protein of unknown function (DUF1935), putative [Leishmania donovani]TPP49872.1 hypothetical protein CGC21_29190 [Leishmania donovani]CAM67509.1 conserved hypothetical protein [Leishmania infantum JPCM5]CBZ33766.1 hypothetical protein, conserved [Leishmania donovani]|eukprot:XP_001465261.1 conserved hypothetical protein [Leishmania infantum JPCM5]
MGCGSSAPKADTSASTEEVRALSVDMKTHFANIDPEVLGPHKESAKAKLAFMYGKTANIFLLTTEPFHKPHHQPKPEGEEHAPEDDEKQASAVEEIRWTLFNDGKSDATVEATFFRAEALRPARAHGAAEDAESPVKLEFSDGGCVKAKVSVPAGATVAFVEGPIKGYMWKCMVLDPKTSRFEPALAAE